MPEAHCSVQLFLIPMNARVVWVAVSRVVTCSVAAIVEFTCVKVALHIYPCHTAKEDILATVRCKAAAVLAR